MDTSDSQNKFVLDTTGKTRRSLPKLPDSQWFHVFFIYKTILPDKEIVAKLILHLEDLGYICGNHQKDFAVGKTILRNVQDCLQKSLTLVILLSKEFCKSKWCEYDLHVAQQLKINKGTKLQIIPLVLDDCDIPDLISHITYLEIDTKNIDAWYGRFLQSVDESMNLDNPIVQSSSSSSIYNGLYNWSPEDDPVFEHARWSPKCPYIIAKEGKKYIDLVAEAVREVEWELLSPQRSLSSSLESLENCILSPRKSIYELIFQANGFEDLRADSGFLSSAFGSTESLDCQSTRTVRLPRYLKD
ncbi:hypothetical protein KUTeg_008534 [Tegillarca granosa]|uniref:TIR domain-containing protein n=1 Tax=Tegillarca granosa TaxID=220873 RepID=A0ABQ9F9F5_TEGGR|nr:hypothetical protein KUTeg_008534 [Tegillarca granosa]